MQITTNQRRAASTRDRAEKPGFWTLSLAKRRREQLTQDEVTFVLRNLATLCGSGVPLPKAVGALADERELEACSEVLHALRRRLESGDTFSSAVTHCGAAFDNVLLGQIRVGERAGTLADTLSQIAGQREKAGKLRQGIVKKLAYPVTLLVVGVGVVGFLLGYVVPVFEETYSTANVPLPGITRLMISLGEWTQAYWWGMVLAVAMAVLGYSQLRKSEAASLWIDAHLLRLPLLGPWLRDVALLQLMEVLGSLMEAGFTIAESLDEAADSVGNRAMRLAVGDLRRAVQRGERFSHEIEAHADLFPPMVSQLVIIGEQTGKLVDSTRHLRTHLHEEIQRKSDLAIGVIEPVLTISLAAAVAVILLAIYLPMFDMIQTVG